MRLVFLYACLITGLYTSAQETVNSSGGNATGSSGTVAYSIGQVFYTTNTGISGNVAQGVQYAFGVFTSGITETTLNISLTAFPNPTTNNLTLSINNYKEDKLTYQLFDLQGKLLISGMITSQQTEINTSTLASATYFVHVMNQENQKVQSFKIIKK
jgi:hypothetical protein